MIVVRFRRCACIPAAPAVSASVTLRLPYQLAIAAATDYARFGPSSRAQGNPATAAVALAITLPARHQRPIESLPFTIRNFDITHLVGNSIDALCL